MKKIDYRKKIMGRMTGRMIRSSLIYLAALTLVMAGGYWAGHSVVWYGIEPGYRLFNWISQHAVAVWYVLVTIGETCIFSHYWNKAGDCFWEISQAMEKVYGEENAWIVLSADLGELESQMNAIKNQVLKSRMQAREATQRKNDLVVYLAHDLKTPLTSVLGYLMLLEEEPQISEEMRQKYLEIAVRKAERLEELINEFFEITRFNLTTMELEKQSINFTRLVEQTIFEFQPMFQEKRLTCRLEAAGEAMVVCDLDKIQRVVDNLLRNAVLYGYEGTELKILVQETEAGGIRFRCTNQGPTIPKEKLERIFEQFYRLDSARTSSTGGAGLGLAIAREIVRLHGGTITAESQEETTVFQVELPQSS